MGHHLVSCCLQDVLLWGCTPRAGRPRQPFTQVTCLQSAHVLQQKDGSLTCFGRRHWRQQIHRHAHFWPCAVAAHMSLQTFGLTLHPPPDGRAPSTKCLLLTSLKIWVWSEQAVVCALLPPSRSCHKRLRRHMSGCELLHAARKAGSNMMPALHKQDCQGGLRGQHIADQLLHVPTGQQAEGIRALAGGGQAYNI